MKRWPKKMIIKGISYRVIYTSQMTETDIDRRDAIWGQIDYHTRTIRAFVGAKGRLRDRTDLLSTVLHEMVHGIFESNCSLRNTIPVSSREAFVDTIAHELTDTLVRNRLVVPPPLPIPRGERG